MSAIVEGRAAVPSFYAGITTLDQAIDSVIARVLDHLDVAHDLLPRWGNP